LTGNDPLKSPHIVQRCFRPPFSRGLHVLALLVALTLAPWDTSEAFLKKSDGWKREVVIEARRFGFNPSIIRVRRGETVRLILKSMDVTHGLALEAYGISLFAIPGKERQTEFVATRAGRFVFLCSMVCGRFHPLMRGTLIVEPNWWFWASMVAGLLPFLALLALSMRSNPGNPRSGLSAALSHPTPRFKFFTLRGGRIQLDLTRVRPLAWLIKSRSLPHMGLIPATVVMGWIIIAGLVGSPVGDHNLAVVLVWAFWWPLLVILLIPLGGRLWCAICPLPAPGEWLQRLISSLKKGRNPHGRNWPAFLQGGWPQNISLLVMTSLGPVVSTQPAATALTLMLFLGVALVLALLYQGRLFCGGLCPLGALMEVYSPASPMMLTVRSQSVCHLHERKDCLIGNERGQGCPWGQYPATMNGISRCGLCMECLHSCPKDNTALVLRLPARGLMDVKAGKSMAFRASILYAVGIVYSATLTGSLGKMDLTAFGLDSSPCLVFPLTIVLLGVLLIPVIVYLAASATRRWVGLNADTGRLWADMSCSLVPLGLMMWVSFALTALATGIPHLPNILADPLGRGWNLFGGSNQDWPPLSAGLMPFLQAVSLLLGLIWSLCVLWSRMKRICEVQGRTPGSGPIPMGIFLLILYMSMIWIMVG
jgi:polyferredoxin/plastocyanin